MIAAFFLASLCVPFGVNAQEQERPRDPWVFRSILDGRPRIVTLRPVSGFPLTIAVGIAPAEVLANWRGDVLAACIVSALIIIACYIALRLFVRQMARREADRPQ